MKTKARKKSTVNMRKLAEEAYNHGRSKVRKTNPEWAGETFSDRPKSVQRGFIAAIRYAIANSH